MRNCMFSDFIPLTVSHAEMLTKSNLPVPAACIDGGDDSGLSRPRRSAPYPDGCATWSGLAGA